ncbi:MAG TPA: ABC transporter permease [Blastocatellia bacterium]|nr:ABC transporter permease [Blastocatellia bacterium]
MTDWLKQDLRSAGRSLRRAPVFTAVALVSLTIGIGLNAAVFSIVNALLLGGVPGASEQERLVDVFSASEAGGNYGPFSYPEYEFYRDNDKAFSGLAAFGNFSARLSTGGEAETASGFMVSANYFDVLEVRPAAGRFFLREDDAAPGATAVIVISYDFWQRRFGGSGSAVGSTVIVNRHPFTLIGVAGKDFKGTTAGQPADVWMPLMMYQSVYPTDQLSRDSVWLSIAGRLRPGSTQESARTELVGLSHQLERAYPKSNNGRGVNTGRISTIPGYLRTSIPRFLGILMAVGGLVLLIACSNIGSILLANALKRRGELAIRVAMGASRGRIACQLLTETLVLFMLAGVFGTILSAWLTRQVLAMELPPDLPAPLVAGLDMRVLGFTLSISLVVALVFGLSPALQASRMGSVQTDRSDVTGARIAIRARSGFVVAQIAMCAVLLSGTTALLNSLNRASKTDLGFNADGVETADFVLEEEEGYSEAKGRAFYREIAEGVRQIPGVRAASFARGVPLSGARNLDLVNVPGVAQPAGGDGFPVGVNAVDSGYFDTLQIPLLRGRAFSMVEENSPRRVAVINQTFAHQFFPSGDAVGRQFFDGPPGQNPVEVVGVVKDGKYGELGEDPQPYFYVPLGQVYSPFAILHVRVERAEKAGILAEVREKVAGIDKNLPAPGWAPLSERVSSSLGPARLAAWTIGLLGVLGVALTIIGIYGIVSYSVAQRTREIGIRVALGASRRRVMVDVLSLSARVAVIGIAIAIPGSVVLIRVLSKALYGVGGDGPLIEAVSSLLLFGIVLAASCAPVMRALRIDPAVALRYD